MRNPEYQFVPVDTSDLLAEMIADYESESGMTLVPASPESLMIHWAASLLLKDRVRSNYSANQNLPSRADGVNLDELAQLFFAKERPAAKPAVCTMRFYISQAQSTAIVVPAGTRVTDGSQTLYWQTQEDAWVPIGSTYVETQVKCQTAGVVGNAWAVGSINTIVDVYDYYTSCVNITISDGGSERLNDEDFYEILRSSLDGLSTAGARGNYIYHAKATSSEISDVIVNSPIPGEVRIYAQSKRASDAYPYPVKASSTLKALIFEACNADEVRPLTDHVIMSDPEEVAYNVTLTYYISDQVTPAADLAQTIADTVDAYVVWQQGKLGRDINPSKLISMLMATGIKRVEVTAPVFTSLRDGNLSLYEEGEMPELEDTIPQVGKVGTITIVNGGVEDE